MTSNSSGATLVISIHAPTRGATGQHDRFHFLFRFQSTLPRGERLLYVVNPNGYTAISIHAPTRGATRRASCGSAIRFISIHAPTRGATSTIANVLTGHFDFNPRSHEGSDHAVPSEMQYFHHFNPRSHEGSDGILHKFFGVCVYFNPRSHEGSDRIKLLLIAILPFQSTLPRGERQQFYLKFTLCF